MSRLSWILAAAGATVVAVNCGGSSDTSSTTGEGGQSATTTSSSKSSSSSSSSSSTGGTGGTGGAGGAGGAGGTGGVPCPPDQGTTLALTKLEFGDGDNGEWKNFGFNIDGLVSDGSSTNVCQPNTGGDPAADPAAIAAATYPDGANGTDNSFGANLLPLILQLYPTWPTDVNNNLTHGVFNALLKLYCLPDMGDIPVMTTKLFGGTPLGSIPKFDGTDMFPVAPELLADTMDPSSSTIVFPMSSVKNDNYDSAPNQTFVLTIPMASTQRSTTFKLTLHSAHVTMKLDPDRKGATLGMIGGVLDTEEFVAEVEKVGYVFGLCGTSVFDDTITKVRQASDIMKDGTQDPTQTCNGISIGLGFEMKEAQIGIVGPPASLSCYCVPGNNVATCPP